MRADRDEIQVAKKHELGIWVAGERSHRDRLLWRPAGSVAVGGGRVLHHPDLAMRPADRIALTGPNGGASPSNAPPGRCSCDLVVAVDARPRIRLEYLNPSRRQPRPNSWLGCFNTT